MEKEREEQSQNDPEAMKTLTRVQVSILLYSTLKYLSCFSEGVSLDTDKAMVTFCSFALSKQSIEYQAEVKKIEAEHQAALEDLRR